MENNNKNDSKTNILKKIIIILLSVIVVLLIILIVLLFMKKINLTNQAIDNTSSGDIVAKEELPEWAEYLFNQNITEIAVYNRKRPESFQPGDSCLPPEFITKKQLESILKVMTKAELSKYNNASGFGGVCVSYITIKYNENDELVIYDFKYIIPKDNNIKVLLEKENYSENNSMKGKEEFDDWYSYNWDSTYLDTLLG